MITRIDKASTDLLAQVAALVIEDEAYRREAFSDINDKDALMQTFRGLGPEWRILVHGGPSALFRLTMADDQAVIEHPYPRTSDTFTMISSELENEFRNARVAGITMMIDSQFSEEAARSGFSKRNVLIKYSGRVAETQFMPILPLTNPHREDIPILAKLMYDAYAKSKVQKYGSNEASTRRLQGLTSNSDGTFLGECSFLSGSAGNYVSACFLTKQSAGTATISELFTHPLYRARGLATSEISASMNRLVKLNFSELNVFVNEIDDVGRRLFSKLGFEEQYRKVEVAKQLRQS